MGRPNKNNAEYFSHDADMRNDIKIKALRRRFSHTGYAVWCYLLETLTDTDFFEVDYGELNQELLAADFDVSVEELQNIIEYSCKINLLQLSEDGKKLYSETHKRRFSVLVTKRERDRERIARLPNNKNKINKDIIATKKELSNDYRNENPTKTELSNDYRNENPHSKVKYSKEEYSKENKKENIEKEKKQFKIPTIEEVRQYCEERKNGIDAETFWNFYQSKGWKVGKEPMKDWKAAVRTWENKRKQENNTNTQQTANGIKLGVGEYIEQATGRRTYGTGKATIPHDAPARPSERHSWDAGSQSWIII